MEEEIWKDIPNYIGYQVSNLGQIRTYNKITYTEKHGERHWQNRILKQKRQSRKYGKFDYRVNLWKNGKPKTFLVARLVAFTFYNENLKDKDLTVNHIDGNTENNNLNNLEIITLKENILHGFNNGLYDNIRNKIKIQFKDCSKPIYCDSMAKASKILGKNKGYISAKIKQNIFEDNEAIWSLI